MDYGAFIRVKFHFIFRFPLLQGVKVILKCARVGSVGNVSVKKTIVGEETDAGARREVPMDIIYIN